MSWLLIGLFVGVVLGLTGAGGSILAVPLLMNLVGMSLKEATTSSLLIVALSAILSSLFSQQKINFKVVGLLFVTSIFGAWISLPLKAILPAIVIKIMLTALALWSLYIIWSPIKSELKSRKSPLWHLPGGFILGGLTTLTGLGGGVVLLPWLKFIEANEDISTSLATIALISSFSLGMQVSMGAPLTDTINIIYAFIAIIVSIFMIRLLVKKVSSEKVILVRQLVFSGVVAFTIFTLFRN